MRKFSVVVACVLCFCQGATQAAQSDVVRETRFGTVVGIDDSANSGTYAWKGVPFAKPPVSDLRWKAPVDPDSWKAPRATQQFANACVQYGRIYGPGVNNRFDLTIATTLNLAVGSEDCLYLNIWGPADRRGDRPVIVFVHGGSNVSGYTADPVYDGAALAKEADAVVVTVNYRLGIFGFLNLPQLKTGLDAQEDSGNFALLDLIKALEFIQPRHREVRRRPDQCHADGPIGRRNRRLRAVDDTRDGQCTAAAVPPRGAAVRRHLAREQPAAGAPGDTRPGVHLCPARHNAVIATANRGRHRGRCGERRSVGGEPHGRRSRGYLRSKTPAALLATLLTKLPPLGLAGSGPIPDGTMLPTDPSPRSRPAPMRTCRCSPATRVTRGSYSRPSSRFLRRWVASAAGW